MSEQVGNDGLELFCQHIFGHFARNGFETQKLSLAYAMVATAVDEVEGTELAEPNGFEAFGIENSFFDFLHINVILVALHAHHHNQPIVAVIARMSRALDVSNSHIGIVSFALHIIGDVLHKISRMIDRFEVFLLQIKVLRKHSDNYNC